ncbi:MAG: Ig-like domain-containing protein, partial [Demequina sp.]
LDNDTAPRGDRLVLAPEVEGSGAEGELAFASRKVLRYLAPQTPGVYTLRYSTFIESNAERMDSSTVTVTVLPTGSNRAPVARVLTARVHVGQTVRIPFDPTGVDPDGDPVTLVEVGQPAPAMGTASVSATGTAISYRAPIVPVPGGQAAFTYTVVDDQGATATGTVRVGVLDGSVTDVAPITYSDYVSAQVGSRFHIPVAPLLNDSDPLQGELRILDVRPHALPGSAEHRRLEGLFDRAAFEADGTVRLLAGDISGTHAYVYTVESPVSLSTAEGRIVVDVSDAASPSMLSVQDTVLTARTRHDLVTGIDVVTGKVQWQGGDISGLTLALWGGSPNGLTVDGWSISGALPAERTVVPFSLSGRDNAGNAVTTYGFLRIPALDDMRLQLAPDITPVDVGEEETAQFDVLELLDIGPSDAVDLRGDDSYAVQRANARCVPAGGVRASYAAGRESPWSDTCSVVVRLQGQDTWSVVAVPIAIMPKDPQAILNPLSRTIRPAEQDSVALVDELVTWEGGRVGDESALGLSASYSGSAFDVTTAGGVLRATAHADAVPGTRETVRVSSAGFGGLDTTITLVVGAAAPDSPRGASFTHTCDVSAGSSCAITVVGAAGEYDPFAGATGGGLRLASVGTSGTVQCAVATVTRASDTQVRATWPGGPRPEGGECIVNFTVTDAQGRSGAGTVTIDVRGYPRPPATVTTVGYTGTSVTLNVALGPAAQAHPNVNTVSIHRGGAPVAADCRAAGSNSFRCTVSGLTNGQPGTYTARAVNAVGESLDSSAHTTWAYEAPVITSVTAEPAYRPRTTTTSQGIAVVTVVANADTRAFMIAGTDQTFRRQGPTTTFEIALPVGAQTLQLVPVSEFQPPTGTDNRGQSARANVTVAGSPSYASGISADANGTSISITGGELNTNSSAKPATQVWFAWAGGARPECSMDGSGRAVLSGSGYLSSTTRTISGLESNTSYSVAACGSNGYGSATTEATTAYTWVAPTAPDGSSTYRVSTSWQRDGDRTYRISLQNGPSLEQRRRVTLYYWYDGSDKRTDFRITEERVQQITAAYCSTVLTELCGERIAITPTSDSPPTTATVTFPSPPGVTYDDGTSQRGCFPAGGLHADSVAISAGARGSATVTTEPDAFVVTWSGPFINAATIRHAVTVCDPPPTPEPDPTTTPTP